MYTFLELNLLSRLSEEIIYQNNQSNFGNINIP